MTQSRSSKWARAMACRTSPRRCRPPTRSAFVDLLSAAGLASHRSVGVCQPEVGSADGRRGRGLRRHHPAARRALHRARAEPRRARPRPRRGRHRGRDLRGGLRDLQPQEHQSDDRRLARRLPPPCANARRGSASACARTYRPRSAVRSKATSRRSAWPRCVRRSSRWVRSKCRSATRSASRIPGRYRLSSARWPSACRSTHVALHFHDTRGTALANVLTALDWAWPRSTRRPAASAAARMRQGRPATSRPKI